MNINTEQAPAYVTGHEPVKAAPARKPRKRKAVRVGDDVIAKALAILESRLRAPAAWRAEHPAAVQNFVRLRVAGEVDEHFLVLYLDAQHGLIEARTEARGTASAAAVYPRNVVRSALELNASAVVFAHNHPSGMAEPSSADRRLTDRLVEALKVVEVRVLDHIVVGGDSRMGCTSFAERGWI